MGATEVQAAAEAEGLELTEIVEFGVSKVTGARSPANGTPILLMKGMPPAGAGAGEPASPEDVGRWIYPADDVIKASRTFTAADRRRNAQAGNALPDGSFPIPDADALRRAAILARSKKGNWKAARRLIARRAKELGVGNPLVSDDDTDDAGNSKTRAKTKAKAAKAKAKVAAKGASVDTGAQGDAAAKAIEPLVKRIADLEEANRAQAGELAKANERIAEFAAMPREGGPVLSVTRPGDGAAVKKAQLLLQAEEREHMARTVTNPDDAAGYAKRAAELRAEAARLDG